jgi:hypothetical protein
MAGNAATSNSLGEQRSKVPNSAEIPVSEAFGVYGEATVSVAGNTIPNELHAGRRVSAALAIGARVLAVSVLLAGPAIAGNEDAPIGSSGRPVWAEHAARNAMDMVRPQPSTEEPPPIIPTFAKFPNIDGYLGTYQPGGNTKTAGNAFFTPSTSGSLVDHTVANPRRL